MEKKAILIGDSKKFMVKAVVKGLEAEGYEVIGVNPEPDLIKATTGRTPLYIMYLEDPVPGDVMEVLRELIDTDHIMLFLIGSNNEFDSAFEVIPEAKITRKFERPLNVKMLASAMNDLVVHSLLDPTSEKKKILVVDDDGVMLRTIKEWLSIKYEVYIANSGMNAITFLANNKVDLILLDYMMPVVSGPQVFAMLRNDPMTKSIPVMFLTAKSDKTSVLKVAALKPEKYLLKSMPPPELVQQINEFFEGRS
ncbi:response regulator [Butyrivibrio fibrisolvens]|jgi:CheY-like chemotaxis protein|uniref:response regulator n=1 Tax=Butyrivibrio fibrisolvens TaxID=831 RepID=UPI000422A7BD|nr:response regulator [Butyrivibrio fibrisolvens]